MHIMADLLADLIIKGSSYVMSVLNITYVGGGIFTRKKKFDSIIKERIFGTNVLKIAVFIYTNKMLYGIIRVAFV